MHFKLLTLTSLAGLTLAQTGPFEIASADLSYFFKVQEPIQSGSTVGLVEGGPGDQWTYDSSTGYIALPGTPLVLSLAEFGSGLEVRDSAGERGQGWSWDTNAQLIHSDADIAECITRNDTNVVSVQCMGLQTQRWEQVSV